MAHVHLRPEWHIPQSLVTPESVYRNRRQFIRQLGLAGAGLLSSGAWLACGKEGPTGFTYPAQTNDAFDPARELTPEQSATAFTNFYEFTFSKRDVAQLAERFVVDPWSVEVSGLVARPKTYSLDDLLRRMPFEERVYRFRCVEAWAMTVPWTGFPLQALIREVEPLSDARYIRFVTFLRPEQAPNQQDEAWMPWPYAEGLSMAEATNELTMLATGIYGHELPKQNGAPVRLVVPWQYGFKSIKSIVRIEFVAEQPPTFWTSLQPALYQFHANVDPSAKPPVLSQSSERLLGSGEVVRTLPYNGYGDQVAQLYG